VRPLHIGPLAIQASSWACTSKTPIPSATVVASIRMAERDRSYLLFQGVGRTTSPLLNASAVYGSGPLINFIGGSHELPLITVYQAVGQAVSEPTETKADLVSSREEVTC
jgi:hypothetical protein